jgi:hypothetical protein
MDCHHSKLNGTVFGMHDWPDSLRGQAAMYRKLAEQTDDPFVKNELLELASVCEEVANNIEDHLTGESVGPNAFGSAPIMSADRGRPEVVGARSK